MKRQKEHNDENLFNLVFEDISIVGDIYGCAYYLDITPAPYFIFCSHRKDITHDKIFYHNSFFKQRFYGKCYSKKPYFHIDEKLLLIEVDFLGIENSLFEPIPKDIFFQSK
jgi:hypothetical protein